MQDPKTQEQINEEINKIDDEWAKHIEENGIYDGDEDWRIAAHDEIKN